MYATGPTVVCHPTKVLSGEFGEPRSVIERSRKGAEMRYAVGDPRQMVSGGCG
jgi:hypothetical protein